MPVLANEKKVGVRTCQALFTELTVMLLLCPFRLGK